MATTREVFPPRKSLEHTNISKYLIKYYRPLLMFFSLK